MEWISQGNLPHPEVWKGPNCFQKGNSYLPHSMVTFLMTSVQKMRNISKNVKSHVFGF